MYDVKSDTYIKPEKPYTKEKPNNNNMEEKEPRIKYFNPASIE